MNTKNRIALIKLSEKLVRQDVYAEKIGVKVELKKVYNSKEGYWERSKQDDYSRGEKYY